MKSTPNVKRKIDFITILHHFYLQNIHVAMYINTNGVIIPPAHGKKAVFLCVLFSSVPDSKEKNPLRRTFCIAVMMQ
jgi:hypothetical protein